MGFIAGVFRLGDSVTAALEKVDKAGIDFWLVDNTIAGSEQLLYASRPMFAIQLNSETESLPSISDGEHP